MGSISEPPQDSCLPAPDFSPLRLIVDFRRPEWEEKVFVFCATLFGVRDSTHRDLEAAAPQLLCATVSALTWLPGP